ncbi:MAG: hypothetical protein AAF184_25545 [Pseudomonadota bacterium]
MARFPKVQRPCPLNVDPKTDVRAGVCRHCERQVVDLNAMSDTQREAFVAGCDAPVCVSYSIPVSRVVAASVAGAMLASQPLAAQESADEGSPIAPMAAFAAEVEYCDEEIVTIGGIEDGKRVEYIDTAQDLAIPALPVTYENESVPAADPNAPAKSP